MHLLDLLCWYFASSPLCVKVFPSVDLMLFHSLFINTIFMWVRLYIISVCLWFSNLPHRPYHPTKLTYLISYSAAPFGCLIFCTPQTELWCPTCKAIPLQVFQVLGNAGTICHSRKSILGTTLAYSHFNTTIQIISASSTKTIFKDCVRLHLSAHSSSSVLWYLNPLSSCLSWISRKVSYDSSASSFDKDKTWAELLTLVSSASTWTVYLSSGTELPGP